MSTLLLGGDGAIGLLLASWLVALFNFFPHDPVRSIAGGIIATVAPYAVYRQSFFLMCGSDSSGALSVRPRTLLHGYKRKQQVEHGLLPLCNRSNVTDRSARARKPVGPDSAFHANHFSQVWPLQKL
ncbi:hypothetical protein [Paraburkholderia sp. Cpub6]|uniref:hypothetical protein n=1 Tax=Paraburkholderia sp. Cpub6 TaxID=2723094 RepID=UPI0017E6A37F|nr:hypothetical protein [Paraburkholderia sp. Cpub6]MBB5458930.1 hypothetical protein [Paraburkholderia sp. Cpub6]